MAGGAEVGERAAGLAVGVLGGAEAGRFAARSILLHAAAKATTKEAVRDDLPEGLFPVDGLSVAGRVGRFELAEELPGTLAVSPDQERSSSTAVPTERIVAGLLDKLPMAQHEGLMRHWKDFFAAHGDLPPLVDETLLERSKQFLEQLRSRTSTTARGSVSFTPSKPSAVSDQPSARKKKAA